MRTTLNLDEKLIHDAMAVSGIQEKTLLIHKGLQSLIQEASRQKLALLYGKIKDAKAAPRRRLK